MELAAVESCFQQEKKLIYVSGRNINDKIEKIKDKKHAEELLNQFFNLSQDIMCMANLEGYFTKVNPALENFLGLDKEKILGTSFFNFIHPDDIEPTIFIISELKKGKKTVGFENRYLARGNKYKWLSWNAVYNCDDNLIYATARDVSKTKEIHEKLQIQASYDPLTGLINRRGFEIKIQNEISRANRYNHPFSIFMIDIDNFKRINDSLGHSSGDFVLRKFAQILKLSIRNTDYAARYGGEEFIAILPETNLEKAFELAERVRKNIYKNSIYFKDNLKERISISIGVATFPKHGGTRKEIIDSADAAMYIAKRKGKNRTEIAFGDCDFEE